jgi:hypothetical protein
MGFYAFDILAYDGDDLTQLQIIWHSFCAVDRMESSKPQRARQDRTGPVRGSLQNAPRGFGVKTPRTALPRWPCDHWIKVKNRKHPLSVA